MDFPQIYDAITMAVVKETGASDSLVHVHAGMAVLMIARLLTGRSLATPVPLLIVVAAALFNELLDRINQGHWLWPDTSLDVLNTTFWPFVLFVGLRARRLQEARRLDSTADA